MYAEIVQCYGNLCVDAQYQSAMEQAWSESEIFVFNCFPLDTCGDKRNKFNASSRKFEIPGSQVNNSDYRSVELSKKYSHYYETSL